MKLKYKILWIEDNPISIRRDKNKIIEYITDLGFECVDNDDEKDIVVINSFDDFQTNIGYAKTADYDLLLIDLDLGKKPTKDEGESIIRNIRDEKIYAEIVFYSSQYEELQKKLNEHFVEGIFTSSREELADKVESIIDVTIKKTQDINNLRGLIMAEVAELDRLKKSILLKYNAKNQDISTLTKYIKENIFEKINEELSDLDCVINPNCQHTQINFENLLNNFFYDSYKKSRTVFKIKKLNSNCTDIPFVHQDYYNNVIAKRNVLAHEEEKTRDDGTKYLNYPNGNPLEFNAEHCINIRKDIKRYKEILKQIEQKLDE